MEYLPTYFLRFQTSQIVDTLLRNLGIKMVKVSRIVMKPVPHETISPIIDFNAAF